LNLATWINDSLTDVEQDLEIDDIAPDKFVIPNILEVKEYFFSKQKDLWEEFFIDREVKKYYDYYVGNGWKVAKKPMKDWKAAVRNWIKNCESIPIKKPKAAKTYFAKMRNVNGFFYLVDVTQERLDYFVGLPQEHKVMIQEEYSPMAHDKYKYA